MVFPPGQGFAEGPAGTVLSITCATGYYWQSATVAFPNLAEWLVKAENKGAAAFVGSSSMAEAEGQTLLCIKMAEELMEGSTIGEALMRGKASLASQPKFDEVIVSYHLFGDPAMRVLH